jgi:transposase-like protein
LSLTNRSDYGVTSLDRNTQLSYAENIRDMAILFIDEVFIKIDGKQHYLWRAVDQDGEVVDVFLQKKERWQGC